MEPDLWKIPDSFKVAEAGLNRLKRDTLFKRYKKDLNGIIKCVKAARKKLRALVTKADKRYS